MRAGPCPQAVPPMEHYSVISELGQLLNASTRIVFFTGAGISTESGISDFRSPGGVWSRMSPIYYQDFVESEEARRESWRRKIETDKEMLGAEPNSGHGFIARLDAAGRVSCVITQNIDGLHQRSGVSVDRVIELHGNATYASCLSCAKRFELEPIKTAFENDGVLPVCDRCQGLVKTATISFGQPMPVAEMERAEHEATQCDLFIVIGSSLVVYPAAALPGIAKVNGAALVILNREPTELDELADVVINAEIGETLAVVGQRLSQ